MIWGQERWSHEEKGVNHKQRRETGRNEKDLVKYEQHLIHSLNRPESIYNAPHQVFSSMLDGRKNSGKNKVGAHSPVVYNVLEFIKNTYIEKHGNNTALGSRNRTVSEIRL